MDVLCNDHMQQNSRFILTCHESLNRKMKNKNLKQRLSKNILYNKGLQRVPMWMKKSFEACYYSRLGFTRQTKEAMLYENKMNSFFILFTFWMSHRAFFLFNLKSSSSAPVISRYILRLGQTAQQQLRPRCHNCKMYLEIREADERALRQSVPPTKPLSFTPLHEIPYFQCKRSDCHIPSPQNQNCPISTWQPFSQTSCSYLKPFLPFFLGLFFETPSF